MVPLYGLNDMKTLILMQGIPGSGKTSFAKTLVGTEARYFSTDDFWMLNGEYVFEPKLLGFAHSYTQHKAAIAMALDYYPTVIIDNTNITKADAQPYFDLAEKYGYEVEVISVQVPLQLALDRNDQRSEDRKVPVAKIVDMYIRMEKLV